jgi:ferredoxin
MDHRQRAEVAETYHAKVLTPTHARRLITVDRDVEVRKLEQVLPYRRARDLVLKNPSNIVAFECPCRANQKNPCTPTNVCLVVGDPFADMCKVANPRRSRRISVDEAVQILTEEHRRGHVHTAWFKTAMLDRYYALCNCCSCCCLGIEGMKKLGMTTLQPSGYLPRLGEDCIGCGRCAKKCPFDAIVLSGPLTVSTKRPRPTAELLEARCLGCGVCETMCKRDNIVLERAPAQGVPLDIDALSSSSESTRGGFHGGQEPLGGIDADESVLGVADE